MTLPNYGPEDHARAYELWRETHNMDTIAKELGCSYNTPFQWRKAEFTCECPWHNWEKLDEDADRALIARNEMLEQGIVDPFAHAEAMKMALGGTKKPKYQLAVREIVRSDSERLAHLELLYAKVMYDLTGIPLTIEALRGKSEEDREAFWKSGRHVTSLDNGIKSLEKLLRIIDSIRHRNPEFSREEPEFKSIVAKIRSPEDLKNLEKVRDGLLQMKEKDDES